MRAVNLIPRDSAQPTARRRHAPILGGCVGVVVAAAIVAGLYLQASSSVGAERANVAASRAELAAVPKPVGTPATLAALPQQRQARVAVLASALSERIVWDRLLREVSLVLPEDVWLTTLSASTPFAPAVAAAPGGLPTGFSIQGFTYSQDGVARLLSRLSTIPDLERVTLQSSSQTTVSSRPVFQFSIVAAVHAPGAPS
jgi:Tfp pilus assembly protein PilN